MSLFKAAFHRSTFGNHTSDTETQLGGKGHKSISNGSWGLERP